MTPDHWGVLVAQRNRATAVGKILREREAEHFIPMLETQAVVRGRRVRTLKPWLGDYILISICSAWKSLLGIKEVSGIILNANGLPAHVLPKELERLRACCVNGIHSPRMIRDQRGFSYGDCVTPKEGPLAFRVGHFDKATKRGEFALFMIFGREQRVMFKAGELIAA